MTPAKPTPNPSQSLMSITVDAMTKLRAIIDTLEAEAKYMANPATQRAKAKQIKTVEIAMASLDTVFDSLDVLNDQQFKLEACSISHGVSPLQLQLFMSRPTAAIVTDAKLAVDKRTYRLPVMLVEQFEPTEVKTATKPVLKWVNGVPDKKLRLTLPSVKDMIEGVGG